MPYIWDTFSFSYVYYPEGSKPPKLNQSGEEFIPGYTDAYVGQFPNQPYSQQYPGGTGGTVIQDGWGGGNMDSPSGGTPSTGSSGSGGTSNDQRNAAEYLNRLFEGYGLGSLAPKILEFVQQGYDTDTIALMLQDTSEYKTRFKANEQRRGAGMSVLSPAEYLNLERQYRQLLSSAGMPAGFWDSTDDFTTWLAGDVSPAEIQDRVQLASSAINSSDSHYIQTLRSYGIGDGDLAAYMLDSKRALPLIQKTVRASMVGAEASRNSLGITQQRAEYFADLGVGGEQARGAYQTISENLPTAQKLGGISGESFGQGDLEDELLGGSGLASAKRKRLSTQEISRFAGKSGTGDKALSGRSRGEY